jgi:hypothetical protein
MRIDSPAVPVAPDASVQRRPPRLILGK